LQPGDGRQLRKLALHLAVATYSSLEFYTSIPVDELFEIAEEVKEAGNGGK
jgi:hypothetical protein